jgi:hypothetical protein
LAIPEQSNTLGTLRTHTGHLPGPASQPPDAAPRGGRSFQGKPVVRRGRKATGLTGASRAADAKLWGKGRQPDIHSREVSIVRRLFGASAEALIIVILVFGLLAMPVLAAKGGGNGGGKPGGSAGGAGTISLNLMDGATQAHFAARVTFTISTTSTTSPFVHLQCYQSGTLVAEGRQGFFEGALGDPWFYLYAPSWQAGAADCTATLEKYSNKGWSALASTSFHVYE